MKTYKEDNVLDRVVCKRALIGNLSNAKWVKVLATLVAHFDLIKECRVKLIWEETYTGRKLLITEYTDYQFDYYPKAMEAMITGEPRGWYAYREIEWLECPRNPTGQTVAQNLEAIQAALAPIGQMSLVLTQDALRLEAYRAVAG